MGNITRDKVYISIQQYIEQGKDSFIIYPYGNRGKMVEQILCKIFEITDYILVDNNLQEDNILSLNQLKDIADGYVLLICSDDSDIYKDIRESLKKTFHGEICDLAEVIVDEKGGLLRYANGKQPIENVNEQQRNDIFKKMKKVWQRLGKEEPYFSVISHDEMKTENITEQNVSKFFASGRETTREILNYIKRNGIDNPSKLNILELGCGCGRITQSLAECFGHVNAVDISEGNLKIVKENIVLGNVDFFLIKEVEDYEKLPQADIIYSCMVLQHNCPPVTEYILNIMMEKLKPDGIFMFQIPTYQLGYSFCYEAYMKQPEEMEMHCFPQNRIFEIAYANHCIPLEVFPYLCTGHNDNSMMFILKKRSE